MNYVKKYNLTLIPRPTKYLEYNTSIPIKNPLEVEYIVRTIGNYLPANTSQNPYP